MSRDEGRVTSRSMAMVATLSAAAIPLAVLTLGPIAASADTPPASSSSSSAAATSVTIPKPLPRATVLIFGDPQDRVVRRLQSELAGLGLQVIIVDAAAPDASTGPNESLARTMDAVGAIRLLPSRGGVEVWVMEQGTGRTMEHDVVGDARAPDPEAAMALRAVELLRARLLPTQPRPSIPEEPEPPPTRHASARPIAAPAAPRAVLDWIGLHLEPDWAMYSGSDVCGQATQRGGEYGCFRDDDKQYHGNPNPTKDNSVDSGARYAGARVLVSYDRVLIDNVTLGVRLGWAFRGGPNFDEGSKFKPFHFEVRAAYWFGDRPFSSSGLRPFVFLAGGMAQFDSKMSVPLRESEPCSNYSGALCPVYQGADIIQYNPQSQTATGWHRSGSSFLGGGLGAMYAISRSGGPVLSLKVSQTLSPSTTVLSPELGYAIGF
jgi:hypothetical protein